MSAKIPPSFSEENRDLRKQIGCINGIFQLFDRHHFLTGRAIRSHNHKRLIPGPQHRMEPPCAMKALTENLREPQKEKPRISMELSRDSYSSSSSFSSFDSNRTAQPETPLVKQISIPESSFQKTSKKIQQPSLTKELQSLDLRDVVKNSMYREAHGLSIKSQVTDERRGLPVKHIDSPRPLIQQPKTEKPKGMGHNDSKRVLAKLQEARKSNRDDRLAIPRLSYDGRESQETFKSSVKLKELPRLSLDSKKRSMKNSSSDSKMNHIGDNLQMENKIQTNQENGNYSRSFSFVIKLIGLEDFPDATSLYNSGLSRPRPQEALLSQPSTAKRSKESQVTHSPRVVENSPPLPSRGSQKCDSIRTRCPTIPMELAPWRQHDFSKGSGKMVQQNKKSSTGSPNLSCSVYGEIEKRITQLEFKKSGKDLRALKQILEAMQKTRERLNHQRDESAEFTSGRESSDENKWPQQNSNFTLKNNSKNDYCFSNIKTPPPTQSGSSIVIMRSPKVIDRVTVSNSSQVPTTELPHLLRLQMDPKYTKEKKSARRLKAIDSVNKNSTLKHSSRQRPPAEKKAAWRPSEIDRTLRGTQCEKVENCSTSGVSSGTASQRLQQCLLTREGQCRPTISPSEKGRVIEHCSKKLQEKCLKNQKQVKSKDQHLSDDQLSDHSSETRYSSYQGDADSMKSENNSSLVLPIEIELLTLSHSTSKNGDQEKNSGSASKEDVQKVKLAATTLEQPSPVSVLDAAFYSEDFPSPVKRITTAFPDENPSPDEAEWNLENLNPLWVGTTSNCSCDQRLENAKYLVSELRLLKTEPDEKAENGRASQSESLNPAHMYINKLLLTSGLLKDTRFISTGDQFPSSCYLINPEMFNVLEQTESIMEAADRECFEKSDQMRLTQKSRRKFVFDLVNEIMVHRITPARLFAVGKRRISTEGLLEEVYLEIDHLQKMPCCNLDEDDGWTRLLNADMMYKLEDWIEYSGEVPALVLDIERLIFKDLINEVVIGEVAGFHDWPKRHCRQLFTN